MAMLSRRLYRYFLSNPKTSYLSQPMFTSSSISSREEESHLDESSSLDLDTDSVPNSTPQQSSPSQSQSQGSTKRIIYDRPLENGLDVGIYKAILVGQVGQRPLQKKLKSGLTVTLLSVGTGGIRNNRRPLENEEPREYANRSAVQWHRVSIYPLRLGDLVMKHVVPGSILYLEGNLETKIFTDPITGLVRRIREVAIRRNGRIVFLGNGGNDQQASSAELKGAGYY